MCKKAFPTGKAFFVPEASRGIKRADEPLKTVTAVFTVFLE
jgi:hypothetical protein